MLVNVGSKHYIYVNASSRNGRFGAPPHKTLLLLHVGIQLFECFFTKFEQFSLDSLAYNALNVTIGKQMIQKQIKSTVHNIIKI